jgi:serine phosphatase RsbU (regulator of sigma subunit)
MTVSDLENFKSLLLEREHNLASWLDSSASVKEDDIGRVRILLGQIKEALERVENQTFGECKACKGEVEHHRLEVQPVTEVCLDCISKQEQTQLEEELFLASKIHRALLPQSVEQVEGFEVKAMSLAARTVGGDYYDFLPSANGESVRVVIADVMGKGLPAGLLMSNVQGALRVLSEEIESPSLLMARLNQWLCHNVPVTKFISLVCVSLLPRSGEDGNITYTNAGHLSPLLFRKGGAVESLEPTGGVLGVHEDFTYEERDLTMSPGDLLLLYTDGVSEAENQQGDMFEEERLIEFVRRRSASSLEIILDGLLNNVRKFCGKEELGDDFTVIALRKTRS